MDQQLPIVTQLVWDTVNPDCRYVCLSSGDQVGPFLATDLLELGIRVGVEFSPAFLKALNAAALTRQCKVQALAYLGRASRSERETRGYLVRGKCFPRDVTDEVMRWLAAQGWVDDAALAKRLVERLKQGSQSCSRRMIAERLRRRGISEFVVRDVLKNTYVDEFASALVVGRKKLEELRRKYSDDSGEPMDARHSGLRNKQLVAAYLARKGYGRNTVIRALEDLFRS